MMTSARGRGLLLVGSLVTCGCPPASTRTERPFVDAARAAPAPVVPKIDELDYFTQLKSRRPDLLEKDDDCYLALVLKPKYRPLVLDASASYRTIVSTTYNDEERRSDVAWVTAHQEGELLFCSQHPGAPGCGAICAHDCVACPNERASAFPTGALLPVHPAGYPLCNFVGYAVGTGLRGGARYDATGVVDAWKVFLEFHDDFARTLTPSAYLEFSNRLAAAGYQGDSKIFSSPAAPERVRFQYNDVILHARSPADAKVAEKVAIQTFGAALAGYGRGVDVGQQSTSVDWHHYLCAEKGDLGRLPAEALDFVHFRD